MEILPAFWGTVGIVLGMGILRFTWRSKNRLHVFIIAGGWLTILGSVSLWGLVSNADWGIALGTMVFTWVALIILGFNAWSAFTNRRRKPEPVAKTTAPAASAQTPLGVYGRRLSTFFLAGPLGGGVAILLTLSAFELLQSVGIQTANAIVTTFFLTPLLWAAIATWVVIDDGTVRNVTLLFCFAALGAVHLGWGT